MSSKYNRLVVLQSKKQALHYANNNRDINDLILPIGVDAMYFAEKQKWEVCSLGELFHKEEYKSESRKSVEKIERLIEQLNNWSSDSGLEMGNYYAFQLWVVIGQIHYNYFLAKSLARFVADNQVLIYTKKKSKLVFEMRPDPDTLLAYVFSNSKLFTKQQLKTVYVDENYQTNSLRELLVSIIPDGLMQRMRYFRDQNRLSGDSNRCSKLLLVGGGYDWFKIARRKNFGEKYCIEIPPPLSKKNKYKPEQSLSILLDDSVIYDGIVALDLTVLKQSIQADLHLFAKKKEKVNNYLTKIDAIVTAVLTFPRDNFYAHMATKLDKNVLVWQHGEKGQAEDYTSHSTELQYATDYLAYAPEVARQYQKYVGRRRLSKVHNVGSIGKNIPWKDGDTILYATGKWFKTAVPFIDSIDPDRRLFNAHTTILDYLDNHEDLSVILKANNTLGFNSVPYEYNSIDVEYSVPFSKLLETAKVVILDTPATTLVEACSTNIPIFVLGGRTKYLNNFLDVIMKRVVWCESPDELVDKLDRYLESGVYEADINNKDYLNSYCASKSGQEVEQAVLGILDKIVKERVVTS